MTYYMNDLELTRMLQASESAVFTTQQLAVAMNMKVAPATVKLNRLVKKGVLVRIMRGKYSLPETNILAVASGIYHPSYVSLLAAFEHHGTTTQSPRIIDVINPVRSGRVGVELESGEYILRFVKVRSSFLTGYGRTYLDGKVVLMAEKEKAVIDSLLFPRYMLLDEVMECIQSGIDMKKLIQLARETERQTVKKRLGHLLSAGGIHCMPDDLGPLSDTLVSLDPSLPARGRYDVKWRVVVNRVIE